MSDHHRQCELGKGSKRMVSWIPEKFAKKGRVLELEAPDGSWDNGWSVLAVGARMTSEQASQRSQDYKHQRKASDI